MADDLIVNAPPDLQYKAQLMEALYNDPKTRPQFLQLVKQYAPNVRIPEIDTAGAVVEAVKPYTQEIGKMREEMRQERADREAERERHRVLGRQDLGLSSDDVTEIDKVMKERGISNFETAAEFHALGKRAAAPRSAPTSFFTLGNPQDGLDMKKLFADPIHYTRERAHKVWDETRGGR